jgi:hypothetical protein
MGLNVPFESAEHDYLSTRFGGFARGTSRLTSANRFERMNSALVLGGNPEGCEHPGHKVPGLIAEQNVTAWTQGHLHLPGPTRLEVAQLLDPAQLGFIDAGPTLFHWKGGWIEVCLHNQEFVD